MKILVLNAGSSSQKSCLYEITSQLPDSPPQPLWEAQIDWIEGQGKAQLTIKTAQGKIQDTLQVESPTASGREQRRQAIAHLLETLWSGETQVIESPQAIDWVGHRVVHGGQDYCQSTLITPDAKAAIARLCDLAPAHNPANLEGIEAIEQILGADIPQVAVFDTAFHSQMPLPAMVYPLPYECFEQGIRRYGFHGISHQYCAQRTAQILGRELSSLRLITCHLGNGCSLSAIREGHSIDTTMGFTPLEGLMMGSRSGSVDPGVIIHLLRHANYSADQLEQLLNRESGLKGISGVSNDLRPIWQAIAEGNARAQLAFEMYIHSLRKHIGAMLMSLGGLDALVFTGGVGENQATVRASTCEALAFLGLKLDLEKNQQSPADQDIATPDSTIRVVIVHTEEAWAIAQDTWKLAQKSLNFGA